MKSISIDIETFSSVNLQKSGVYRYCESPDFLILLFAYSIDEGEVQVVDVAEGEEIPSEILQALSDPLITKWAFNAQFERICLSRFLGLPLGTYLNPEGWKCSLVWSATLGLPLSLEGVGAVLGLEKQKLQEGKSLIKFFCVPNNANEESSRNLPVTDPKKWERFKAYNKRDVETELGLQARLAKFPVRELEWQHLWLDQKVNDTGIALDMSFVEQALQCDAITKAKLRNQMQDLTDLENPNSVSQMRDWLSENGLETESLGKEAVSELMETAPAEIIEVLSLRQELAKSSMQKYTAMANVVGIDGRARGLIQFYGANRTGRYAGRLIQVQNLPQNHLPDLDAVRQLVKTSLFDAVDLLYSSTSGVLSELIRTAFISKSGTRFIVADFSAIEARIIAWLAGEKWRMEVFASGGDIYCASASKMFHVPVEKNGINGHLRQKGKVAELACIAEGELVLTEQGLVPIEEITTNHRLWDGIQWVNHQGVIDKGMSEVMIYEGLRATEDHLVWVKGSKTPIPFGIAASRGAHLLQTGDGGRAIRLGEDYQSREKMEQKDEPLLCSNPVPRLRFYPVARTKQFNTGSIKGVSILFTAQEDPTLVGSQADCRKTKVREPKRSWLCKLWCQRNQVSVPKRDSSWTLLDSAFWNPNSKTRARQNRQQRRLCSGKPALCIPHAKQQQQAKHRSHRVSSTTVALCQKRSHQKIKPGINQGRNHQRSRRCSSREKEKLATNLSQTRLYDIQNAGPHHRFTVSGKLVHNCGFGGGAGALKAMGALQMGLEEQELRGIITTWRKSNPRIVKLWWDVDKAAMTAIRDKTITETHGIRFSYVSGMLFITLPSGRNLAYVKPRIGTNKFDSDAVTYEGVGATKKWERLESYGPKLVENIVQATARDILAEALLRLNQAGYTIVMHVHDEVVLEVPFGVSSVEEVCQIMSITPIWAHGLLLDAAGFECEFYKKN